MDRDVPEWVPDEFKPNDRQKAAWWAFVLPDDGTDAVGWWLGWCPIHDTHRDPSTATAAFNFDRDAFRCSADPSCHPGKRGMSLTNLKAAMGG